MHICLGNCSTKYILFPKHLIFNNSPRKQTFSVQCQWVWVWCDCCHCVRVPRLNSLSDRTFHDQVKFVQMLEHNELLTACLCFNSKANTIKNIIITCTKYTSLQSLKSLVFKPSPPHKVRHSDLDYTFKDRWRSRYDGRRVWTRGDWARVPESKQHFAASWNVSWCQSTVVHSVPVFKLRRKYHQNGYLCWQYTI